MKVTVFGAGAVGSYFGGKLSQRHEVTLVGRKGHVEAIRANGLRVGNDTFFPEAWESVEGLPPQDLVLMTVKAYDTLEAIGSIAPLVDDETVVASVQNGLVSYPLLRNAFPHAVTGVTSMGVTFISPGEVRLAGTGETLFGPTGEDATKVSEVLSASGVPSRVAEDIALEIWRKAVVNASINPVTALIRQQNGALLEKGVRALVKELCTEAAEVAAAEGHHLQDAFHTVLSVIEGTARNRSSMLQDVEAGRRTEIEEITGKMVSLAAVHGIEVPCNKTLLHLVRALKR
jgi:2-dehydropantoate 2-reductase